MGILTEANSAFDIASMKLNAITEAANRQYNINLREAELKVMKENGTDDELSMLYEAAESDFVENIQKALDKLREAVVKFYSDCRDRLMDLLNRVNQDGKLDALEKKVKLMPLVSHKKIMVENYKAETDLYDDAMKSINKLLAKFRGNQEVTADDVAAVVKKYDDKHEDSIGASNAIKITVSDAIAQAKKLLSVANSTLKDHEKTALAACDDAKKDATKGNANVANQIANAIVHFCKTAQNDYHRCVAGMITSISAAIGGFKKENPDKVTKESTDESDKKMEELMKQKQNFDSDDSSNEDVDIDDAFSIVGNDALTSGLGFDSDDDGMDADDDSTLDDTNFGGDAEECGSQCESDHYLAALAGVETFESTNDDYSDNDTVNSLMAKIRNL